MSPQRWKQIKDTLNEALEIPIPERAAWLDANCPDPEIRAEVESLIAAHGEAGDLMEHGPGEAAATVMGALSLVGRQVGPYQVLEEIGQGGMGTVYRAALAGASRPVSVALKVVRGGADDHLLRRFRHETRILASLEHPNIARLYDFGVTPDGRPYYVMEFIEGGQAIDAYCDAHRLSIPERLRLFAAVCSAVEAAHEKRVIHRDIKPHNILIAPTGVPKLLDFGIAKILDPALSTRTLNPTATVLRMMTPEYASPEQLRGENITSCTDVYSLGVLLYELLTGCKPYALGALAPHEIAHTICEAAPARPSTVLRSRQPRDLRYISESRRIAAKKLTGMLSGDLDNIVMTALRKEPERRYPSAAAMEQDIIRYLEGRRVSARTETVAYRTQRFLRRNRALVTAAVAASVLAVVGTVAYQRWWRAVAPLFAEGAPIPRIAPLTSLGGNETQAAFSPDGTRVAFVWSGETGENTDIYIRVLETGRTARLTTNPADDISPAWSPDGSRIAFLRTSERETALYLSPATGGIHGRITSIYPQRIEAVGRHLAWSTSGRQLAIADKTLPGEPFAIYLLDIHSGVRSRITHPGAQTIGDTNPAFSPDGRWMSFLRSFASGITEIYVMALPGGEPRRVTFDGSAIESQTWAPDSRSLVFCTNRTGGRNLWQIPLGGGVPRRLPAGEGASEASFSADGSRMAFTQLFEDANIWQVDLQAGSKRKLLASSLYDSSPSFSPDGTRIVYRSTRSGHNDLWMADSRGRDPWQYTRFGGPLTGTPRWSPDGRWVAFDSRPDAQADIFIAPSGGGAPQRITRDPAEDVVANWSRDSKYVYFASNRGGTWQVWKAPVEGGGTPVQVTLHGGFAAVESPDGKYLYYAISRSEPGLFRMPLAGGDPEPVLTSLPAGYWGYWALGRDGVYFAAPEDRIRHGIFLLPYRGGEPRRLAGFDFPAVPGDSAFALSPDGRYLIYTQVDQSGSDIMLATR